MQLLIPLYLQLLSLTVTSSNNVMMRDSPTKCGDLTIPYPFSIGLAYTNHEDFLLICNDTFKPPRTFIRNIASQDIEVVSLNPFKSTATIKSPVARLCDTSIVPTTNVPNFTLDLSFLPYTISSNSNKLIALGCNAAGIFDDQRKRTTKQIIGCTSMCTDVRNTMNGMCSGSGCCEISIPSELQHLIVSADVIVSNKSDTYGNVTPCSYAFLIDQSQYEFTALDLTNFYKRETVPVVLDWVLMDVDTCDVIFRENPHNLCGDNADCLNSDIPAGYRCICKHGFNGNPYVPKGCNQDINECDDPIRNSCSDICINTRGSYYCSCPHGYKGDGKRSGSGCYKYAKKLPLIQTIVGCGLGLLFLFFGFFIFFYFRKKRRILQLRESFFKQNGGLLLEQKLSAQEGVAEATRIFTEEELELATENYASSRVLGHGGNGTVYKGILRDKGQVVAIKKSHIVDTMQIEQFINEVVLLSQVVHKNVVRLLGCCLETQVPLLVYEYVSNGTLDHHLHSRPGTLDWIQRLRIAGEMAGALAYLHSALARPIFHRDVKAANILLDHNYMAKMSDFGASRLIPLDRTQITTLVMGTFGYLDPEYFQTGQLTEKSDVYSFGVVLAELLTGQKPVSRERQHMENLAIYFILKLKEGELQGIVEQRVKIEGSKEQIEAIAELTKRCLELKGDERPTMKEVAAEIERVGKPEYDAWETTTETNFYLDKEEEELIRENNINGTLLLSESETGTKYFSTPTIVK